MLNSMNNDYKIMQLINHGIYVITNEFDKILIIPCSLGHSASHENNNHVALSQMIASAGGAVTGSGLRRSAGTRNALPRGSGETPGSSQDPQPRAGTGTSPVSAQGLSHPAPSSPRELSISEAVGPTRGSCHPLQHR